jgi:hypothetical protein
LSAALFGKAQASAGRGPLLTIEQEHETAEHVEGCLSRSKKAAGRLWSREPGQPTAM